MYVEIRCVQGSDTRNPLIDLTAAVVSQTLNVHPTVTEQPP